MMDFIITMSGMFTLFFLAFVLACYDPIWGDRISLKDGFVFLFGKDVWRHSLTPVGAVGEHIFYTDGKCFLALGCSLRPVARPEGETE